MPDRPSSSNRRWPLIQTASLCGTFLPRRCGIGTFTADLSEALAKAAPNVEVKTVAMNDRPEGYRYPPRVWFEINQNRVAEYRLAADFLNMANVDVCCLQHEFGIYGGTEGRHIGEMLRRLRMPVVTTLHTILKDPTDAQRESMRHIVEMSDRLVVMAERAHEFLTDIYDVPRSKIQIIQHGIPDVPFVDPNFYKDQFDVEGKRVILTFGLLSPNKGIENMVEALPRVVEKFPDVVYIVLGATHPGVIAHAGEEYRIGLKKRAEELGVADHIDWYDKFVELEELVEFLGAADVYVTPYLNEAQITSGTLAYAAGAGKAIVSTPYWHAQELLAEGRGKLVPFKDPGALADAIVDLFENEVQRHAMRKRAYQYTRQSAWQRAAEQYLDVFQEVREERNRSPKPIASAAGSTGKQELAEIKLDHLLTLTDSCGCITNAHATVPDRRSGYLVDDNARALITVLLAQDHLLSTETSQLDALVVRFLSLLDHALDPESGRFRSLMLYDRTWDDRRFSEDSHARGLRGLGECVARTHVQGHLTLATSLFHRALPAVEGFEHVHGMAYSLIGIHAYLRRFSGDSNARRVREMLAERLFERFKDNATDDWPWPVNRVTYTSARLPHALLMSGRWMFRNDMIEQALRSLEWLHGVQTAEDGRFAPVGSEGWYPRGGDKARFNQMPTEAAGTIDACIEAYRVTKEQKWIDRAHRCLGWFRGDNDLGVPMYDNTTGGCCDALMPHGVSENQGAEATLAWLMSLLAMYDHALIEESGDDHTAEPPPDAADGEAASPRSRKQAAMA
jgi:glycosyltransferase involved in cell wall biosynthesis